MLSVSGVVRPGHVETRHLAHPTRVDVIFRRTKQTAAVPLAERSMPAVGNTLDLAQIRHFVCALRQAR